MRAALNSGPMTPVAGVRRVICPPVLADRHLLEPIKVAQHITPLGPKARAPAALIQLLAQDQGQKGAEHVTADGRIRGMVDGPRAHQRLGGPEELLHLDQVAVAQDRLQGRDPGVGAQHEQAVVARLLGDLADIDLEGLLGGRAQVSAVGGVADQRLVAPLQLLIEGSTMIAWRSAASFSASASLRHTM